MEREGDARGHGRIGRIMMGTFRIEMGIGDPQGLRYEYVEALVDSGSTYNPAQPTTYCPHLCFGDWA